MSETGNRRSFQTLPGIRAIRSLGRNQIAGIMQVPEFLKRADCFSNKVGIMRAGKFEMSRILGENCLLPAMIGKAGSGLRCCGSLPLVNVELLTDLEPAL